MIVGLLQPDTYKLVQNSFSKFVQFVSVSNFNASLTSIFPISFEDLVDVYGMWHESLFTLMIYRHVLNDLSLSLSECSLK